MGARPGVADHSQGRPGSVAVVSGGGRLEGAPAMGDLFVMEEARSQTPAVFFRRVDAKLMGEAGASGDLIILGLRVVAFAPAHCAAIPLKSVRFTPGPPEVPGAGAQVIDLIAAAAGVVRVIHESIHIPVQVTDGVDEVQGPQAALEVQGSQPEIVIIAVFGEPIGATGAIQVGVVGEHPVGVQGLLGVLNQQLPVGVDLVGQADAPASVSGVVEVILHQGAVVRRLEGAVGMDGRRGNVVAVQHGDARGEAAIGDIVGDVVYPAPLPVVVRHQAHRQVVSDRRVHIDLLGMADIAAPGRAYISLDPGLKLADDRLVGDQAHGAGLGAGPEQGALGPRQHLDALQVGGVVVHIAPAEGDRLLIHIQGHRRGRTLDGGDGVFGLLGGGAADVEFALAGAGAHGDHIGQVARVIVEGADAQLVEVVSLQGGHGHGDVLGGFSPLGGGDDHLLDLGLGRTAGGGGQGRQERHV